MDNARTRDSTTGHLAGDSLNIYPICPIYGGLIHEIVIPAGKRDNVATFTHHYFFEALISMSDLSRFFLIGVLAGLCFTLTACSSKVIEQEPIKRLPVGDAPVDDTETGVDEPVPYPEWIAGTVNELYGEGVDLEQSERYHEAVADNPLLRYIILYFDFNSSVVSSESQKVLLEHAGYLAQNDQVAVRLEGHADKRGSSGYNLSLGEQRAFAVQEFLRTNGVRAIQITAISYGEERPAMEGDSEAAYAKNRRVELIYR